jgi:hypothetical protein
MNKRLPTLVAASIAALLAASPVVRAQNFGDFDIETRFRAKIAKEKAKQASSQSANERNNSNSSNSGQDNADCGSQNIGNVNTGGRPGQQPREVFVFAPNSINVVTANGCR